MEVTLLRLAESFKFISHMQVVHKIAEMECYIQEKTFASKLLGLVNDY